MNTFRSTLAAAALALAGFGPAQAIDRITIDVVNDRPFILSLELRDMHCGGNVVLRDQLDAGERRAIEICANSDGVGALGATYGSGCSQVKRTDFKDIEAGAALTF